MRLLADENIQDATVELLRSLGNDVRSIKEEGLASVADEEVFSHAQKTGRTLITYNADFSDIRDLNGRHHGGIIRLRISNQRLHFAHPILEKAFDVAPERSRNTLKQHRPGTRLQRAPVKTMKLNLEESQ